MAENNFLLNIVTPEDVFYSGEARTVVVRTVSGDVGLMKNHAPYVAPLGIGKLEIIAEGKKRYAVISQGYVKCDKSGVQILTDTAEWAENIDVTRAEAAKRRAESRLASKEANVDRLRAEVALQKAIQRINISELK